MPAVPLRDLQEAASHADPRTTVRRDRTRISLDRHATFVVAANPLAGDRRDDARRAVAPDCRAARLRSSIDGGHDLRDKRIQGAPRI